MVEAASLVEYPSKISKHFTQWQDLGTYLKSRFLVPEFGKLFQDLIRSQSSFDALCAMLIKIQYTNAM